MEELTSEVESAAEGHLSSRGRLGLKVGIRFHTSLSTLLVKMVALNPFLPDAL